MQNYKDPVATLKRLCVKRCSLPDETFKPPEEEPESNAAALKLVKTKKAD